MESGEVITVLIWLPLYYNPDAAGKRKAVEDERFIQTAEEIAERFGGGTLFRFHEEPQGFWWDRGVVDRDVHALIEVDVPNTDDSRGWLRTYAKKVLMPRFDQKALYLKFVGPVQVLEVNEETVTDEDL